MAKIKDTAGREGEKSYKPKFGDADLSDTRLLFHVAVEMLIL